MLASITKEGAVGARVYYPIKDWGIPILERDVLQRNGRLACSGGGRGVNLSLIISALRSALPLPNIVLLGGHEACRDPERTYGGSDYDRFIHLRVRARPLPSSSPTMRVSLLAEGRGGY